VVEFPHFGFCYIKRNKDRDACSLRLDLEKMSID